MDDLLQERFWSKVDKGGDCWLWTASKRPTGYGHFHINLGGKYRMHYAHRIAMYLEGHDIKNKCVLHKCDNPSCVKPDHLYVGTPKENYADMITRGRHWQKKKTHCKHGHEFTKENIYYEKLSSGYMGRHCKECSKIRYLKGKKHG